MSGSLMLSMVTYTSIFRIAFVFVMFLLWTLGMQWVDRDAQKVKTVREKWNIIGLGSGILGLFAWIMLPWTTMALFFLGWGLYVFIVGGGLMMYVSHRNQRVAPNYRVMTAQHFSRLLTRQSKGGVDRSQHEYRVRLFNAEKKAVELPDTPIEAEQFSSTQELLYDALWRRASEVELASAADNVKLTYRIDGILAERRDFLTVPQAAGAITFLKTIAGLDLQERRRPQKGKVRAALLGASDDPASIDVMTSGTTAGERIQMRILHADAIRTLSELGLHEQRLQQLQELIKLPAGVVICSGPSESGVTSTLYAIIKNHDAYIQNIHSLEKRKLLEVDNITQHAYDPADKETTYARKLQSVLRREPDVVMLGELDDKEVTNILFKAAAQEKKIYAGLTASDSFDALDTLLNWTEDRKTTAKQLKGILNQRLIRKLCPTCREAYKPDATLLKKANLPADKIEHFYRPPSQKIYDKQGREIICPTCQGTGYTGRIGVFELLVITDPIRAMIETNANTTQIRAQARKGKTYYLQEEGLLKAMDGSTSINEVLRALKDDSAKR